MCYDFRMEPGTWTRQLVISVLEFFLRHMPHTSPHLSAADCDLTLFDDDMLRPLPPTGHVVVTGQGVLLDMARPAETYAMRHALRAFVNESDGDYVTDISRWTIFLRPDGPTAEHIQQMWIDLTAPWGWQVVPTQ